MTQEDRQLLLQDLCARLPYKVKVQVYDNRYAPTTLTAIDIKKQECIFNFNVPVENCLPYLRPMSSMNEKEYAEYSKLWNLQDEFPTDADIRLKVDVFDWLNKHHFDYRGLLEKKLALEAPKDMYAF